MREIDSTYYISEFRFIMAVMDAIDTERDLERMDMESEMEEEE
jgi:hypothetical protein